MTYKQERCGRRTNGAHYCVQRTSIHHRRYQRQYSALFDRFAYERSVEAAHGEYFDANWVRCRITLQARVSPASANAFFKQSVNAPLLTTEIKELSDSLNAVLSSTPGTERSFEPMEPYIELKIERSDKSVDITARLDLAPAVGPVIEFCYVCRPEEIRATIGAIADVREAFPERRI